MFRRKKPNRKVPPKKSQRKKLRRYALEVGKDREKKKAISPGAYRLVGDEVLGEQLDPKCWAEALATGAKTKDEALSVYAKIRAEELAKTVTLKETKAKALEERRLSAGAPESQVATRIVWKRGYSLLWDFLFWQVLLSVSGVGLFLVILAMGSDSKWWPGLLPLVVVSTCLQVAPIILYGLGNLFLGKVRYIQALAAAAVGMIALGGVVAVQTLMEKRSPRWVQLMVDRTTEEFKEPQSAELGSEEF